MSNYTPAVTTLNTETKTLTWETQGHYMVGDPEWQDIVFTARIQYNGGTIGISPRVYENNMFMSFFLTNKTVSGLENGTGVSGTQAHARLISQVTFSEINLEDNFIDALIVGNTYEIKAQIVGTNYRIYVNDKLVFNTEYASMARGRVGVYGTPGTVCSGVEVKSAFADGWTSNIDSIDGAIATTRELPNEDRYMYLHNPSTSGSSLHVSQEIDVEAGKAYSFSYDFNGVVKFFTRELNGASKKVVRDENETHSNEWTRREFNSVVVSQDCTRIVIRFIVEPGQSVKINNVQAEPKEFSTGYIHNESINEIVERENSLITFPSKNNINQARGSVSMWVKPSTTYNGSVFRPVLFEYGGEERALRISYTGTAIRLQYGGVSDTLDSPTEFIRDEWYHIVATWSDARIELYINEEYRSREGNFSLNNESDLIRIGSSYTEGTTVFHGAIDEAIVYNSVLDRNTVNQIFTSTEQIQNNTAMIMRATFNHAIGNFNKSLIEATPAPQYGSPIVVEKQDGTALNKVSFFDPMTGEYRTYNEEEVRYDGEADYLTISYSQVDTEHFDIKVRDFGGVEYGAPYRLDGRRLYISLSNEEKELLAGRRLIVSYQLENAFTVDYNIGAPDSFRVNIGKYDGKPVKIHYEGNDFHQEKLATMVELNPLLNPNHEGFLYITDNTEKVTSYKARVTPEDLPANGVSEALVIIEPMDASGNFISHLKLSVQADRGNVIPAYDKESILLRDRAGRYIYRYTSPVIRFSDEQKMHVEDRINAIDNETGLGIQIPITLTTLMTASHIIEAGDTLERISTRYGVSEEDISVENQNMTIVAMREYILKNVGNVVRVPMNYSSALHRRTKEEIAEEPMIVDLLNAVLDFMNEKASNLPNGLGSILDFNGDGIIGIDEVSWLTDNKGSVHIAQKYTALKEWENNNAG